MKLYTTPLKRRQKPTTTTVVSSEQKTLLDPEDMQLIIADMKKELQLVSQERLQLRTKNSRLESEVLKKEKEMEDILTVKVGSKI